MADKKAKKEAPKKVVKKSNKLKITKDNGNIIYRDNVGDYLKVYKAKGYKVEEI